MTEIWGDKEDGQRAEAATRRPCRHHWLIESAQGTTSKGCCKLCGDEREFRNSVSDPGWETDFALGRHQNIGSVPTPRTVRRRVDPSARSQR
jgi:hypothetical protein